MNLEEPNFLIQKKLPGNNWTTIQKCDSFSESIYAMEEITERPIRCYSQRTKRVLAEFNEIGG